MGIFQTLASGVPLTTADLAVQTGLDERYVREWAATMAAAGYIDYSPSEARFRMNPEQAAVLANEDTTFFTAGAFQYAVACYRQLEERRGGRGVAGDHATLKRGVRKSAPEVEKIFRRRQRPVGRSWCLEETSGKSKGTSAY